MSSIHPIVKAFSATALSLCLFSIAGSACATTALDTQGLQFNGIEHTTITLNNKKPKKLALIKINLSSRVKQQLSDNIEQIQSNMRQSSTHYSDLPTTKYIGMNNVAVMDQGQWGTCVTFANSAAIDAYYKLAGDQKVSQLCNLEAGRSLTKFPDAGWNGSFNYMVLGQIAQYGYVDQHYQKSTGCGGLKQYPANSDDNGDEMPMSIFTGVSHKSFSSLDYSALYAYAGVFQPPTPTQATQLLNQVKQGINHNQRTTFAIMFDNRIGNMGALATYNNYPHDTWALSNSIKTDITIPGHAFAHDMVIDGYDDNAVVSYKDNDGLTHTQRGLLRVRNSIGTQAGDHGDYYISYDYFKAFVIEAYLIGAASH